MKTRIIALPYRASNLRTEEMYWPYRPTRTTRRDNLISIKLVYDR